ncbi:MAG: hypothetical protein JOS17DRAFT_372011 [Linnemannia elongata]|nr:MAG: hypothetical protein JOS17DRAFT_372011 [Linnemannia elongata]
MSNKRQLSDLPPYKETPTTPSKRASRASRLQGPGEFGVLDFNEPNIQSPGANQDTPREISNVLHSLSGPRSALKGSTSSWTSIEFNAAEDVANPFWSPAQPSQTGQETPIRIRSAFVPNLAIDSPEQSPGSPLSSISSTAQAHSSNEQNVLLPERTDSSSDDSDSSSDDSDSSSDDSDPSSDDSDSSDTSPNKSTLTPKKPVSTPTQPVLSPFPSPMQFLSSPSQAVLKSIIPLPDKENEDSDDVASVLWKMIHPPFVLLFILFVNTLHRNFVHL